MNFYKNILILITIIVTLHDIKSSGTCKASSDCIPMNLCVNNECQHKELFPITLKEGIGLFTIFLNALLANVSGIGGGGLYISILTVIMNFDLKDSIPFSKAIIFAGAFSSFLYTVLYNSHPERKTGPQFDVTLITFMIPFVALGNQVGIMLSIILPQLILLILMTSVLIYSSIKTTVVSVKKYRLETEDIKEDLKIKKKIKKENEGEGEVEVNKNNKNVDDKDYSSDSEFEASLKLSNSLISYKYVKNENKNDQFNYQKDKNSENINKNSLELKIFIKKEEDQEKDKTFEESRIEMENTRLIENSCNR